MKLKESVSFVVSTEVDIVMSAEQEDENRS